jgi:hypothetical protein
MQLFSVFPDAIVIASDLEGSGNMAYPRAARHWNWEIPVPGQLHLCLWSLSTEVFHR